MNTTSLRPALLPALATRRQYVARVRALLRKLDTLLHQQTPDADAVHEIRTTIKKLRAWIRLLRQTGLHSLRGSEQRLRAVARCFTHQREATVRVETLLLLSRRCHDTTLHEQLALLRKHCRATAAPAATPAGEIPAALAARLLTNLPTSAQLVAALQHSHALVLRRAKQALRADASPEQLHAWRKEAKYFGNQLALLANLPGRSTPLQRELAQLGKLLGLVQDLTVLRQYLKPLQADPTLADAAKAVRSLAARERKALVTQAGVLVTASVIHRPQASVVGN